ncbi:MAG: serine--tRNA ligase [Bacteroidia bacterium]|nr:serine--tRNA ligase [Bacteroidia bacterium]
MLTLQQIRENQDEIIKRLKKRNFDPTETILKIVEVDNRRKAAQTETDAMLAESNQLSKQIGDLFKSGKASETAELKERTVVLKAAISEKENEKKQAELDLQELLVSLPNAPHLSVPEGKGADDNLTIFTHGEIPELGEHALPHWELAAKYDLIDFELGVKITGAGFPVYKGKGARLQRALINFFLDRATEAGYREMQPPHVVNEDSGFGTGQLPDKEGQMYHVGVDNLYLIPTAEVPVTNFYRDVILSEKELPIRNTAYTPCFRREAGSYGKDVRGLNRLHQFDKVEIVQIQHPDKSYETLEQMREYVAGLLKELELPFRTLKLCGGDMGTASALTYDMEVYSAAQKRWLEVSSISNFETYQSNRLKLRFRDSDGKTRLAHTLNGSALALPRIVASLLENFQFDGGIRIPKALVPYTGFETIK